MLTDQQEKLLSYNGELLIFELSKGKTSQGDITRTSTLHVTRRTFDNGTKSFIETSTGSFSMCGKDVEMIHCNCTSDFRTGILHPCILLKRKKKKNIKYILLLLHNCNKFEQLIQFKLDYELEEPVKLLAGPTVVWTYEKKLFYISSQASSVSCAPIQFSSIKWAGEIEGEGSVVLGIRDACLPKGENGPSVAKSDVLIWGSECSLYVVQKQKVLTSANFVPHAYSSVISCVDISKATVVRGKFKTSVFAVTCKSQLIFFQDGKPKDIQQLQFEKPCSVQIATVEGNNQLVVVAFTSGDVCAIWKHNLQVACFWKNVRSVLVDDFAGVGTEQILILLKTGSVSESLNTFQVTDFGKGNTSYEDDSSSEVLQENRFLTIKALEGRLQAGFASVRELQQHLRLKEKVLMQSCDALIDIVQDQKHSLPRAVKDGLVALWDETEKTFDNDISTPSKDPEHLIEEVWYRVVEDNLIVGVKLMEAFEMMVSDVSLSLILNRKRHSVSPVKCQCKVFTLKKATLADCASHWQVEQLPKRIKLDCVPFHDDNGDLSWVKGDKTKIFTAVTYLPSFLALHQVHCKVLLHAKKKSCGDENQQKSEKLTLLCGDIKLSLAEISTGTYAIDLKDYKDTGSLKDLVALCALSHKLAFQITSDYTLIVINTWLTKQMECTPIKECPDYVICCKSGNLNGTLFKWNPKGPFEGTLTIFCRHQTVLFQCLHNLIESLPPNCKIKHLKIGSKKVLAEQLALAIVNEIVTLRHSFSSALSQTESKLSLSYEETSETTSISAMQHVREAFKKAQKQTMLGMNQTISGALYRGLVSNVFESQLNSDMISWQCSSLF
uniref:FA complementation group B n=1 Tax=Varanus komodoensis TaxID=61221 RepID=A0A8D2J2R4_VARKO